MMIVPMSILGIGPAVKESHVLLWNHLLAAGLFLTGIAATSIPITCLIAFILRRTREH
jgi:formate-dependent nitrite reductase membrane component NrfD